MNHGVRPSAKWIRELTPPGIGLDISAARLLCFPHAGGSATYFSAAAGALAPGVAVSAVQYPGRQDRRRERFAHTLDDLAERIADVLPEWLDGRPAAFFGHSMGASVAFEVALRMQRRGLPPTMMFASGRRAPSCWRDERVHLLSNPDLVRELRKLSGTAPEFLADDELLEMILPAVRADYSLIENYAGSTEQLRCPVTVLAGADDPLTAPAEVQAWRAHTVAEFTVRTFPGGHFFINEHAQDVLATVEMHLRARVATRPL